jgi:hypothetical protein
VLNNRPWIISYYNYNINSSIYRLALKGYNSIKLLARLY